MTAPRQHTCGRCGKPAPFGFLIGDRYAWACDEHREAAEAKWRESR